LLAIYSLGAGLHRETPDEIQRIQDAANGTEGLGELATGPEGPDAAEEENGRDVHYSIVWKHFTKGPKKKDGSYVGTYNYCGKMYMQGQSRSNGSLLHHMNRGWKKMPRKRQRPDALQKLLVRGNAPGESSVSNS
jgi:hypothetical protein